MLSPKDRDDVDTVLYLLNDVRHAPASDAIRATWAGYAATLLAALARRLDAAAREKAPGPREGPGAGGTALPEAPPS